jgi:hypothetical protein
MLSTISVARHAVLRCTYPVVHRASPVLRGEATQARRGARALLELQEEEDEGTDEICDCEAVLLLHHREVTDQNACSGFAGMGQPVDA